MTVYILSFIILILLINTIVTNIQVRRIIKILNDENPDEFKEKIQEFKNEYKSFVKRWGKF